MLNFVDTTRVLLINFMYYAVAKKSYLVIFRMKKTLYKDYLILKILSFLFIKKLWIFDFFIKKLKGCPNKLFDAANSKLKH